MTGTSTSGRYAVYFVPDPVSPLARFGAAWLGYDVATGAHAVQSTRAIAPERLAAITAEPRRYGFHATLKPPFALAEGVAADTLDRAVAILAAENAAVMAGKLRLACISGFWALMLSEPCPALDRLAERCVVKLDRFRAPPSVAELTRRRQAGLSAAQNALLERWGYPYVMAEFRFHMTLTERLDRDEGAGVGRALALLVEPLCQTPLAIDAISLFHQTRRDAPFRLMRRYALSG
jgi:putative phosphonate metabolism protein